MHECTSRKNFFFHSNESLSLSLAFVLCICSSLYSTVHKIFIITCVVLWLFPVQNFFFFFFFGYTQSQTLKLVIKCNECIRGWCIRRYVLYHKYCTWQMTFDRCLYVTSRGMIQYSTVSLCRVKKFFFTYNTTQIR